MSAGSGWSSAWNSTTTAWSGADDLLDQRQVIEVRPERPDLPLAEVGYGDAGQLRAVPLPPKRYHRQARACGR